MLIWDYDRKAEMYNIFDYQLRPDSGYVSREVALDFSKAISEGLLGKIVAWLEKRNQENETAIKTVEENSAFQYQIQNGYDIWNEEVECKKCGKSMSNADYDDNHGLCEICCEEINT